MTLLNNLYCIFTTWNYAWLFLASVLFGTSCFAASHYLCSVKSFLGIIGKYGFATFSVVFFTNVFIMLAAHPSATTYTAFSDLVFPSVTVFLTGTFLYKVFHETTDELNRISQTS